MQDETLKAAVEEARQFISKVDVYFKAKDESTYSYQSFPRESGAMKRSSMDLTRVLADLRQGR